MLGVSWKKVNPNAEIQYFQLDEFPQMIQEPFKSRLDFWDSLDLNDVYKDKNEGNPQEIASNGTEPEVQSITTTTTTPAPPPSSTESEKSIQL
jgi:hypothetical protein